MEFSLTTTLQARGTTRAKTLIMLPRGPRATMGRYHCPICNVGTITSSSTLPPKGRTVSGGGPHCAFEPPYASVPEAACTVGVPILLRPRDPAGAVFLPPD